MEDENDLNECAHMWDGSEEWYLEKSYRHESIVTLVFEGSRPSIREMSAFRLLSEAFRDKPLHELKAYLIDKSEVELGRFSGMKAREIQDRVSREKLPVKLRIEGRSWTSYAPMQRTEEGQLWICIIEDDALERQVIQKMLELGVPVHHIEVD